MWVWELLFGFGIMGAAALSAATIVRHEARTYAREGLSENVNWNRKGAR
jgi:hypothetical protein